MSWTQVFFSTAGLMITLLGMALVFFKHYLDAKIDHLNTKIDAKIDHLDAKIDAKIDPLRDQVDRLVGFMVNHAERISALEERTKNL